jgi:hypothetical protein
LGAQVLPKARHYQPLEQSSDAELPEEFVHAGATASLPRGSRQCRKRMRDANAGTRVSRKRSMNDYALRYVGRSAWRLHDVDSTAAWKSVRRELQLRDDKQLNESPAGEAGQVLGLWAKVSG